MQIKDLSIPDVKLIIPREYDDDRGSFAEIYIRKALEAAGILESFVQDNASRSINVGTIRGLHYQIPPYAQAKLIRVSRGRIVDVAVDLRHSSPTYGKYVTAELSAENWSQLYLPIGFAHAFCTLEPNTEVVYKVSSYYAPKAESGILWADPDLAISWPVKNNEAILSEKDARLPLFKEIQAVF